LQQKTPPDDPTRHQSRGISVKALIYNGARDVSIDEVPDAKLELPTDVLIKLTTTNICGSDLHMYEGRTDMDAGRILGHENLGEVVEVGSAVQRIKQGDLVCLPFNIGCGYCKNCERGLTGFCLSVESDTPGGAYGFADMGRTRAVRPSICGCRGRTSTACCSRRMRRRSRTTT
jgi:threonine dehydrogenase-like Zn-dependent dehydrogenase